MNLYKFLDNSIRINKLKDLLKFTLKNYKYFDRIKNLNPSKEINMNSFSVNIYSNSNDDNNLILMYRILEKKFYEKVEKVALRNLKYSDEIDKDDSQNIYLVFATNSYIHFDILRVYLLFYYANLKLNKEEKFLGLDFEFNTKVVALMQINFEQPRLDLYKYSLIFLFNPDQFSTKWRKLFCNKILCGDIYKILHGSDSLDIPFVYENLLSNDPLLIKKFNNYFIDTKFLCEYKFYEKNEELGKCKIYHVLLNEGVISKNVYDKLKNNELDMGPIYDIYINLYTLNENLIDYTLYDVLFLSHLYDNFRNLKRYKLINELTQLTFIQKRNIIEIIPKDEINKINNYMVFIDKPYVLNKLFNKYLENLSLKIDYLEKIMKVNYFKLTLILILKYEFFYYLSNKYTIFEKITDRIKYDKKILKYKSNYLNKNEIIKLINIAKDYIVQFVNKKVII